VLGFNLKEIRLSSGVVGRSSGLANSQLGKVSSQYLDSEIDSSCTMVSSSSAFLITVGVRRYEVRPIKSKDEYLYSLKPINTRADISHRSHNDYPPEWCGDFCFV